MFVTFFSAFENNEPFSIPMDTLMADVLDSGIGDIGVRTMKMKGDAELMALLGFLEGRPAHWCKYKSEDPAITSWDENFVERYKLADALGTSTEGMSPLSLLWHQLVGIASMADKAWAADSAQSEMSGFILADGVGVGKTAQVMGFIALVQQVWIIERGDRGGCRPPVLGEV